MVSSIPLIQHYYGLSKEQFLSLPHREAELYLERMNTIQARESYAVFRGASKVMGSEQSDLEELFSQGHEHDVGLAIGFQGIVLR